MITGIFDVASFKDEKGMKASLDRISKFKGKYEIVENNGKDKGYDVTVISIGVDDTEDKYPENTFIPKYMELAEETVLELVKEFPVEKKENEEYWGEDALYNQISLAGRAKEDKMQLNLIKRFLEEYPGSKSVEYMRDLKLNIERFNYAGASKNVFVNNENYNIRAEGFASGTGGDDFVVVKIDGGVSDKLKRGRVYDTGKDFEEITDSGKQKTTYPRLTVIDIDGSSAKLNYAWKTEEGKTFSSTVEIDKKQYINVGGARIYVEDIEVREVAYVSLLPEVRNTRTEANFTFNIGIEKRAIEISPEKAQKKVDALNKSIADWEDKIEKLGKVIKGLKGACLATSAFLTLKTFITGFSGGVGLARKDIMDVYEAKCKSVHPGVELQKCYSEFYKDEIERDIEIQGNIITAVNNKVGVCDSESAGVKSSLLKTEVVDMTKYTDCLRGLYGEGKIVYNSSDGTVVTSEHLQNPSDWQAVLSSEIACEGADAELIKEKGFDGAVKSGKLSVPCQNMRGKMERSLSDNVDRIKVSELEDESKKGLGVAMSFQNLNLDARDVYAKIATVDIPTKEAKIAKDSIYAPIKHGGINYVVTLEKNSAVEKVYEYNNGILTENFDKNIKNGISNSARFVVVSSSADSCSNPIINPYVQYYESANKQGNVKIVPVDLENGWYAKVRNDDYSDSVIPKVLTLCNVGEDGIMDNGDVVCQEFREVAKVDEIISCKADVGRLYKDAQRLIGEANRNGNGVTLNGKFIRKTTSVGPESVGVECTDFMSVDECTLMFNVCDPVICPTSRCAMGGAWPVSDVIASGIIGSIVLCLPNFGSPAKGGVLIPVCLSGIHAGLDAYVSILRSYKSCLEENIETGRYTGICDEITAIYTCEFFWGQLSPILDILLVRFVEGLYGGFQTKGGAEYLTVQNAFDNMDKSIDYFTSTYAESSFRAFNLKNTEEVGSMVCKRFIGSSVPTSADMIDSLLEPESPLQFYAYFSEDLFSEATVPSTSHYKVYYHIYAGNDRGAQYRVYLKSPPESSYYTSRQTLLVDSGYAQKGIAADEAIDFTAPTGYKELCVSINGQDECGFGSVTSDFGLNYASQAYVADQVNDKQITSTEDCVTTSTSAWAMASPNLQAGVEKSLGQDDIATTGIIRVCASANPDKGVVAGNDVYCKPSLNVEEGDVDTGVNSKCMAGYKCVKVGGDASSDVGLCENVARKVRQVSQGRWIDVGHCDDENMICWLDRTSVEKNIGQYMEVNDITSVNGFIGDFEALKELDEQYKTVAEKMNVLRGEVKGMRGMKIGEMISSGELTLNISKIIDGLDEVAGIKEKYIGQGSNKDKAEALGLKASVYGLIVEKLLENPVKGIDVEVVGGTIAPVVERVLESPLEEFFGGLTLNKVSEGDILKDDKGFQYNIISSGFDGSQWVINLEGVDFPGVQTIKGEGDFSIDKYGYTFVRSNVNTEAEELEISKVELEYKKGFNDYFYFRWDESKDALDVSMSFNERPSSYNWATEISTSDDFWKKAYAEEKQIIINLMKSGSWEDLIKNAKKESEKDKYLYYREESGGTWNY